MHRLGLHIYLWGQEHQSRLLCEWLGPIADRLLAQRRIRRFWFNRFDARGPHLLVLLEVDGTSAAALQSELAELLAAYLARVPSTEELTADELERLHTGCRGRAASTLDLEPGMAANNSFVFFPHGPPYLPFWLGEHLAERAARELDEHLTATALWSIEQLARSAVPAGLNWIAHVDRAIGSCSRQLAAEHWRYHATTLLIGLEDRLAVREAEIFNGLPGVIGARNIALFERLWNDALSNEIPGLDRLIELILVSEDPRRSHIRARAVCHAALKQLGIPVSRHIPLVLYAWWRRGLTGAADERGC